MHKLDLVTSRVGQEIFIKNRGESLPKSFVDSTGYRLKSRRDSLTYIDEYVAFIPQNNITININHEEANIAYPQFLNAVKEYNCRSEAPAETSGSATVLIRTVGIDINTNIEGINTQWCTDGFTRATGIKFEDLTKEDQTFYVKTTFTRKD